MRDSLSGGEEFSLINCHVGRDEGTIYVGQPWHEFIVVRGSAVTLIRR